VATLRPFSLTDTQGVRRAAPDGAPLAICFVKQDCPTCRIVAPLLGAFASTGRLWVVSQDPDGGKVLQELLGPGVVVLNDSELAVSFAAGIEAVPTLVVMGEDGTEAARTAGFVREEWQDLFERITGLGEAPVPDVKWSAYPEFRPGCGSRTTEPGIAERLAAEASGDPLRSRRIEIAERDDPFEFLFDQGLTDGLPTIPPTPERVVRMLSGTKRDPQEVVAVVPPNLAPATVEKVAINAVMAGCRPEYLPVVLTAVEAVCTEEFNMHGVLATTFFAAPVIIVNGPIRGSIGMNSGMNCLGQGCRANVSIGRAVQLVIRNVGGGRPGEVDRATLGQPGKLTTCFAENEERSNWEPLHVERGFRPDDSTVTVFAGGAPTGFIDQLSRDARSLATSYGLALEAVGHPKYPFSGEIVVVVSPEHVDTFQEDRWTKDQIRDQIQRTTERPLRELVRDDACAEGVPPAIVDRLGGETRLPKFSDPRGILLVVAGGEAGKFGAYFQGWLSGPTGSTVVTRRIEE
jgi:hypothetical protein